MAEDRREALSHQGFKEKGQMVLSWYHLFCLLLLLLSISAQGKCWVLLSLLPWSLLDLR